MYLVGPPFKDAKTGMLPIAAVLFIDNIFIEVHKITSNMNHVKVVTRSIYKSKIFHVFFVSANLIIFC